jgi:hypothetical protein
MFKHDVWCVKKQRIGDNPYMQIVDKIEGIDIDYPEDFEVAQRIMGIIPLPPPGVILLFCISFVTFLVKEKGGHK